MKADVVSSGGHGCDAAIRVVSRVGHVVICWTGLEVLGSGSNKVVTDYFF